MKPSIKSPSKPGIFATVSKSAPIRGLKSPSCHLSRDARWCAANLDRRDSSPAPPLWNAVNTSASLKTIARNSPVSRWLRAFHLSCPSSVTSFQMVCFSLISSPCAHKVRASSYGTSELERQHQAGLDVDPLNIVGLQWRPSLRLLSTRIRNRARASSHRLFSSRMAAGA